MRNQILALTLGAALLAGCAGGARTGGGGQVTMPLKQGRFATAGVRLGAAPEPARVIEVTAREYQFEPKVLHVRPGEQVTVRLRNAGKERHEWEAEGLHAEIRPVPPGATGEVTFTAPMKTGTYEFACHVDGHYEKGMIGFVVVR